MLTNDDVVDIDDGGALLVSVSELARMKGISRQAVSKRLARMIEDGVIVERHRGREKVVSLAEWDAATNEYTDLAKVAGRQTRAAARGDTGDSAGPTPRDASYTHELTRKARYDADLKELELRRIQRTLVPVEDIVQATTKVAEAMIRDIEQIPTFADDFAAAFNRGGVAALREELRSKARYVRQTMCANLNRLANDEAADTSTDLPN